MLKETSRDQVIGEGMRYLQQAGADGICRVCIRNGGSCCSGCRHLLDKVGCQRRNTSCTAWLCGFLQYVLYELNLLDEWNDFWAQVPGRDFRGDHTPEFFFMSRSLSVPNFASISEALAADLEELTHNSPEFGFILTLREQLDHNIERLDMFRNDPKFSARIHKNLAELSAPFHRFHKALLDYRLRLPT